MYLATVKLGGKARQAWLSEFLELPYGIPSHDTFGRVFALLDPAGLHQAFLSWTARSHFSGQHMKQEECRN
jgi:hypothetical protein